jgi:AcrR family transcriptional regulator
MAATKTRIRMTPQERAQQVLEVAVKLATKRGLRQVTRGEIAEAADCSAGLVTKYLGGRQEMQTAIVKAAIKQRIVPIVATAIADRYPAALRAPEDLKAEAIAYLAR